MREVCSYLTARVGEYRLLADYPEQINNTKERQK